MLKVQGKVDKLSALSRQYADFSAKKYKKIQNINKSAKRAAGRNQLLRLFLGTYILLPVL
ncbi:hypothetical protein IUJ34_20280 [Klebsiella pneumoniae subsp. pneumoniae]|uniref:Uncharacterized protein n=1 Tax=Klebsiella pneumoniae subsp. pneumoniae TaxID=72407 RepID=A0A7S9HF10_KLEPN|nr:hypothetical protein IUJ34_20280 [Klebsiella pneumoniae subsp. pneumoniae]